MSPSVNKLTFLINGSSRPFIISVDFPQKNQTYQGTGKIAAPLLVQIKKQRVSPALAIRLKIKLVIIYTGGARLRREWEKMLSIKTGAGASTVVAVKLGTVSNVDIHWLAADK